MGAKELVEYIAQGLVDSPEEVSVNDDGAGLLELKVADDDRGKVIGRKGRTAHAVRTLLSACHEEDGEVNLEIVD